MALSKFKKRNALFNHFVLMLLALSIILPILILFFNSLKPQSELLTNPLGAPMTLRFTNYYDAFVFGNYSRIMLNSLYFVVGTLVVCLPLSALASFSLAILSPRGKLTTPGGHGGTKQCKP